jgi:hypothetical protein
MLADLAHDFCMLFCIQLKEGWAVSFPDKNNADKQ